MTVDLALFDGYKKAWNEGHVEAILDYFTDDCMYEDVALNRINRGKDELKRFAEEIYQAFPDFHLVDNGDVIVGPDGRYASEWTMTGTHDGDLPGFPASHKTFSIRGISVGELDDSGKIKRNSDYWSLMELLAQVGALPALLG